MDGIWMVNGVYGWDMMKYDTMRLCRLVDR
jgi:hypothetical protein